jgi:hypothetical protein
MAYISANNIVSGFVLVDLGSQRLNDLSDRASRGYLQRNNCVKYEFLNAVPDPKLTFVRYETDTGKILSNLSYNSKGKFRLRDCV